MNMLPGNIQKNKEISASPYNKHPAPSCPLQDDVLISDLDLLVK
jgi:hypothetical protein